jgi:triosephosphate isomerase
MAARRQLIAGNWKMNGLTGDGVVRAKVFAERVGTAGVGRADLIVCPPATILGAVGEAIRGSGIALGAQDCHAADSGAHTGDISAAMLADLGCSHVIVGHSERRASHSEIDSVVREKVVAAQRHGLVAIVCVGESLAARERGETLDLVGAQIAGSVPADADPALTVIAYEPVWAIGTGRTPTVEDVARVHAMIRQRLSSHGLAGNQQILYGGSVNPGNAAALLATENVGGALVGGASLDADDLLAIAESCP